MTIVTGRRRRRKKRRNALVLTVRVARSARAIGKKEMGGVRWKEKRDRHGERAARPATGPAAWVALVAGACGWTRIGCGMLPWQLR